MKMTLRSASALFAFGFCALAAAQVQTVHPDSLAGHWDASDGRDGDVGMDLVLTTDVPSTTTDLVGVPQRVGDLSIGLYERAHTRNEPQHFYFSTSINGGATWDGQHLRIYFGGTKPVSKSHIDLTWVEPDQAWTGSFDWNDVRRNGITFRRPSANRSDRLSGTWFEPGRLMNNCLHLARMKDGTLLGWGDDIHVPGYDHYANGLRPPAKSLEHYGEPARVTGGSAGMYTVELRAGIAVCCSHPFIAKLSEDGQSLQGQWPAGPNQALAPARWVRVEGGSCLAAASRLGPR